mgnify:CR=1 FL=1|jgi:hypothetical protein
MTVFEIGIEHSKLKPTHEYTSAFEIYNKTKKRKDVQQSFGRPTLAPAKRVKLLENKIMMKYALLIFSLGLSSLAVATPIEFEDHSHTNENKYVIERSGRTDANGGHNCSDKSKRKGLCSGYHYHR